MSPSMSTEIGGDSQPAKTLPKSLFSFRVLTECPIIVVLLFSTHKQSVNDNLPVFVPLIVEVCIFVLMQREGEHRVLICSIDAVIAGGASGRGAHSCCFARGDLYLSLLCHQESDRLWRIHYCASQSETFFFVQLLLDAGESK